MTASGHSGAEKEFLGEAAEDSGAALSKKKRKKKRKNDVSYRAISKQLGEFQSEVRDAVRDIAERLSAVDERLSAVERRSDEASKDISKLRDDTRSIRRDVGERLKAVENRDRTSDFDDRPAHYDGEDRRIRIDTYGTAGNRLVRFS